MNIYKLKEYIKAVEDGKVEDVFVPAAHFAALVEIARIADLINVEFRTDPDSVQCFDLSAIVYPLDKELRKLEAI